MAKQGGMLYKLLISAITEQRATFIVKYMWSKSYKCSMYSPDKLSCSPAPCKPCHFEDAPTQLYPSIQHVNYEN